MIFIGGVYIGGCNDGPTKDAPGLVPLAFQNKLFPILIAAGAFPGEDEKGTCTNPFDKEK